ncbi:MAG: protein translocase subunit SecD [Gemmatimonadota bacterium]|jgi:preprotein translocase subunit SecD|nr:protein translocase subunit SecD [Gemmatimonadota bacterium]
MLKDLRARLLLILGVIVASLWLLVSRGIILGLDLQGGTYLALEVDDPANALTVAQRSDAISRAETVIRTRIDELGVAEPGIQKSGQERLVVELPGADRETQQRAKDVIQRSAFLQFQIVRPASDLDPVLPRIDRAIIAAGLTAGSLPQAAPAPVLPFGTDSVAASPDGAVTSAGPDPAAEAPPTDRPFSGRLIPGGTGAEAVYIVAAEDIDFVTEAITLPGVISALPRGTVLRWGRVPAGVEVPYRQLYLLEASPLITGERLIDAQAQRDTRLGQPIVTFQFDRQGGRLFERGTSVNVGNLMAIVLDNQVFSAPVIRQPIGAQGQIEMSGSGLEEAGDLALVLRAGSLPAPIQIVEERAIGPSLGQDSIDRSIVAGVIGVIGVIWLMVGYYRFSGILAIAALAIYVLVELAGLSALGATLTLPGIAGFILSIGMAVDANVLIFERIREEIAIGRTPRAAVVEGFSNALSAIIDGHVTTLLTALVLFQFGTGPVRGFAVTLVLGTIASLFTAVFVTRTFFMVYLDRHAAVKGISV